MIHTGNVHKCYVQECLIERVGVRITEAQIRHE